MLRHYAHLLPGQLPLVDSTIDVAAAAKEEAKERRSSRALPADKDKAQGDDEDKPSRPARAGAER